jgi:hypothetical protein
MIQVENPMKRILATAGIAGIALLGVAAPATAGDNTVSICHATGSESNPCPEGAKSDDGWKDGGWKDGGWKDGDSKHDDHWGHGSTEEEDCVAEEEKEHVTPPVETPPVETPPVETPPVETPPVETPPVETPPVVTPPVVTPPVVTPPAVVVPAGAAAAPVVNRGFNAQTAAGSQTGAGMPAWFGGLTALLGATGLVALRHRGRLQDFQKSK